MTVAGCDDTPARKSTGKGGFVEITISDGPRSVIRFLAYCGLGVLTDRYVIPVRLRMEGFGHRTLKKCQFGE